MWEKVKEAFKKHWKWIVGGLGTILALLLLGRRRGAESAYKQIEADQRERLDRADDIVEDTKNTVEGYYERKKERRGR